jgi:diaminopimelate epimerase
MELDFTKMHGAGNDFVLIDDLSEELELTEEQVRFLCDRHFGIGADGLVLVRPPKTAGSIAYMHYINDDGSRAEMCGNAVRCFAKYLVDRGFVVTGERRFTVDTLAGRRAITFEADAQGALISATVDMGEPVLAPTGIPTTLQANTTISLAESVYGEKDGVSVSPEAHPTPEPAATPAVVNAPLATPLGERTFTCVNMGNPHAVTFIEAAERQALDLKTLDISVAGSTLETSEIFPQKANIEFAEVLDPGSSDDGRGAELFLRVWERGVGETLACGTGTCATVVAAVLTGRAARSALVHLRGGDLHIEWLSNNHVMMTGPAATVYEGTIRL